MACGPAASIAWRATATSAWKPLNGFHADVAVARHAIEAAVHQHHGRRLPVH
jgi:hypothetical protein